MILGASGPLVPMKVWYLEHWRDDDVGYQAQICHIDEGAVTEPFNSSQSLFNEIELLSFFHCQRRPPYGEELVAASGGVERLPRY